MEITTREHLHQVDLLSPAPIKITEREYWKTRREQEKLDTLNTRIIADGMKPRITKYQTQKQFLRDAINDISAYALSVEEFQSGLKEKYSILLKISRDRYSYLHPDRGKYITGRNLGNLFEKEYLTNLFSENERKKRTITADTLQSSEIKRPDTAKTQTIGTLQKYNPHYNYDKDPMAILFVRSDLRLVIDLQHNIKAQQNAAYAQKVKLSNLKEMAKTVCYIQEHGFDSRETLHEALGEITHKFTEARKSLRATEDQIKKLNEQIHYVGQYQSRKSIQTQFLKSKNKGRFRKEHHEDLDLYNAGVQYIKEHFNGKPPSLQALKSQRNQLLQMKGKRQIFLRIS